MSHLPMFCYGLGLFTFYVYILCTVILGRWSYDGHYFARMSTDTLSIYETPVSNLVYMWIDFDYWICYALLGSHTYSVRAFCFGRRVCLLSVCPASDFENWAREVWNFVTFIGNPSKCMTSDFAPEVAKYPKSSVWANFLAPLLMQLVWS